MSYKLPDPLPTETVKGYAVSEFKLKKTPIHFANKVFPYEGRVYAPITGPKSPKAWMWIDYDERGRCLNYTRSDCFVNIFDWTEEV